jgi:hypothetical protein
MKKMYFILGLIISSLSILTVSGQTSISSVGTVISENFDALSNVSGTYSISGALTGWHAFDGKQATPNEVLNYSVDNITTPADGKVIPASVYSAGGTGTDRAFAVRNSGAVRNCLVWHLQSNTSETLTSFDLSYDVELWREGNKTLTDNLKLYYAIGDALPVVSSGSVLGWTALTSETADYSHTTDETNKNAYVDGNGIGKTPKSHPNNVVVIPPGKSI